MRFCVVTEKILVLVEKMFLQTSIEYPYYRIIIMEKFSFLYMHMYQQMSS